MTIEFQTGDGADRNQCLFAFGEDAAPWQHLFVYGGLNGLLFYIVDRKISCQTGGVDDAKAKDRGYAAVGRRIGKYLDAAGIHGFH